MEAQDATLIRDIIDSPRRHSKKSGDRRTNTELRLRDAKILLRLYIKAAPQLTELNGRTTRWLERHGKA